MNSISSILLKNERLYNWKNGVTKMAHKKGQALGIESQSLGRKGKLYTKHYYLSQTLVLDKLHHLFTLLE